MDRRRFLVEIQVLELSLLVSTFHDHLRLRVLQVLFRILFFFTEQLFMIPISLPLKFTPLGFRLIQIQFQLLYFFPTGVNLEASKHRYHLFKSQGEFLLLFKISCDYFKRFIFFLNDIKFECLKPFLNVLMSDCKIL